MENSNSQYLQQVHIAPHLEKCQSVLEKDLEKGVFVQEQESFRNSLLQRCPAHLWPGRAYETACPRPILINKTHQRLLEDLHEALVIAITDIVERWWIDDDARFPERMPLEKQEEDVLRVSLILFTSSRLTLDFDLSL